jgi:hypothetical protein
MKMALLSFSGMPEESVVFLNVLRGLTVCPSLPVRKLTDLPRVG